MVNSVKEGSTGAPGGAFYINEYKHVLVPTSEGCLYAGKYAPLLRFSFEGVEITPEPPPGLSPGGSVMAAAWRHNATPATAIVSSRPIVVGNIDHLSD